MHRIIQHGPLAFCLSLVLLLGFLLGYIAHALSPTPSAMAVREEIREMIPVITLQRPQAGYLEGSIKGDARVFVGDTVQVNESQFRIAIPEASQKVKIVVPEGMNFVASKKGKKYYSVFSPEGEKLAPDNRIYFKTAADAEAKGYKK
jgi:hypothetical protein